MKMLAQAQIDTLIQGALFIEAQSGIDPGTRSGLVSMRKSLVGLGSKEPAYPVSESSAGTHESPVLQVAQTMRTALDTLLVLSDYGNVSLDESHMSSARQAVDHAYEFLGTFARMKIAGRLRGIYVIVDPEATLGRPVTEVAAQSLRGGARVVQLRDKLNDKGPMLELARELKSICAEHDALFVMNDHADLACASDADVLHVGQTDLPVSDARRILGPHQLIGNSNGTMEEALKSQEDSVDYIAVGAIYATTTMGKSGRRALGPEMIARVKDSVSQPIVAIGGINRTNITEVAKAGADSICVVSAITFADDPKSATEELVELYESAAS